MRRAKKQPVQPSTEKRLTPGDTTMEKLAAMPVDVQKMVLGYAYGLMSARDTDDKTA